MKKLYVLFFTLMITLSLPLTAGATAAAESTATVQGPRVYVRVEGVSRTIATGEVSAYTFREALAEVAAANGLTLTYVQSGAESKLVGVEGADNSNAYWTGFIIRSGQLVRQDAYLDLTLQNGDEAVLYQGNDETMVALPTVHETDAQTLTFFVGVGATDWVEENGTWVPQSTVTPVEGVNIHATLPGNESITLQTNAEGNAVLTFDEHAPVAVFYYAEADREGSAPSIVRTAEAWTTCGFTNLKTVTRAEAVAFMLGMCEIKKDRPNTAEKNTILFTDIDADTSWYDEIVTAEACGLVAGYEDGTFRPENPINLMELCVLTARLFPALYDESAPMDDPLLWGLPVWAADAAGGLYHAGLLEGLGTAWPDAITLEALIRLYVNLT